MKIHFMLIACTLCCALSSPPRRHVYWDRPHSSLPSWFPPDGLTSVQKTYYTLISHFGSAVAAGFGSLFGPLGAFVSSFSQPYLSTYVSRLTGDVVARSAGDVPAALQHEPAAAKLMDTAVPSTPPPAPPSAGSQPAPLVDEPSVDRAAATVAATDRDDSDGRGQWRS